LDGVLSWSGVLRSLPILYPREELRGPLAMGEKSFKFPKKNQSTVEHQSPKVERKGERSARGIGKGAFFRAINLNPPTLVRRKGSLKDCRRKILKKDI